MEAKIFFPQRSVEENKCEAHLVGKREEMLSLGQVSCGVLGAKDVDRLVKVDLTTVVVDSSSVVPAPLLLPPVNSGLAFEPHLHACVWSILVIFEFEKDIISTFMLAAHIS